MMMNTTYSTITSNPEDLSRLNITTRLIVLHYFICPILFGIITLVGIFGNSLVIYVIISEKKWRTVMNIMLLNLAIADLSFVIVCPPFTAYRDLTYLLGWKMSGIPAMVICKLMNYLLNVTVYVTIYTLVLISIIRYLAISGLDNRTKRIRSHKNVVRIIIIIWMVMLTANTPILKHYGLDDGVCQIDSGAAGKIMFTTFTAFAYVIPLITIVLFSTRVRKRIQKQSSVALRENYSSHQHKVRASRLLVFIVATFAILWLPVHLYLMIGYWGSLPEQHSELLDTIAFVSRCMAYSNSCLNPIIYNFVSKEFRESFHRVIFCRKKENDAVLKVDKSTAATLLTTTRTGFR